MSGKKVPLNKPTLTLIQGSFFLVEFNTPTKYSCFKSNYSQNSLSIREGKKKPLNGNFRTSEDQPRTLPQPIPFVHKGSALSGFVKLPIKNRSNLPSK